MTQKPKKQQSKFNLLSGKPNYLLCKDLSYIYDIVYMIYTVSSYKGLLKVHHIEVD